MPAEMHDRAVSWDEAWDALEGDHVQLYTTGTPQTIHQFWARCYFEDLWSLMGEKAAKGRYLEIGAGRGTASMYLASKGADVTMLDLSPIGLRVAEQNFVKAGLKKPKTLVGDARETGLPAASFDCILSIGLIEHFEYPKALLQESVRLLAPGGLHYGLIIPESGDGKRFVVDSLFAPWRVLSRMVPRPVKDLVRPSGGKRLTALEEEVVRNDYSGDYYIKMLRELGIKDAVSIPTNPYHPVYGKKPIESSLVIPAYRFHHAIKRALGAKPMMKTLPGLASCQLLLFRKPQ